MRVATCVVLLLLVCDHGSLSCDIEGYYWRDYDGTVPDDAIAACKENNNTLYIGQAPVGENDLFPGKIIADSAVMIYPTNKENRIQKNIKILCTRHLHFFQWIPSNNTIVRHINKHFVIGGYSNKKMLHLGRATINGETIPGILNVFDNTSHTALFITHKFKVVRLTSDFEVLVYDPKITK